MLDFSSTTIVNGTLILLVAFSVVSWTIIPMKALQYSWFAGRNRSFAKAFWSAPDLEAAAQLKFVGPAARVAQAGFAALSGTGGGSLAQSGDERDRLERSLRVQLLKERHVMEGGLSWLASIGSTSPFVGLFGTVWGIKHALQDITKTGAASLDVVAGPIGEALIATAIGIAVAIPAVLAYNFFLRRHKIAAADLEGFATDFMNLAVRHKGLAPSVGGAR
ncbi:MAG: MotA/TolQ/ExbB proton channel family protein [Gammaproteobacteria bacterium]|nr:MotA/TolQ/ExbB proton channel family protein [Gammaproteobacteria bacterium]MBI5616707.1 MotA/TolQ/ExbB proton channel family protein [Gammaproteobacteria bacterium]